MHFTVINHGLSVCNIDITGISISSIFLIGDANTIATTSAFDTPAESLVIGPFVQL
ncbi:spore gernimation protein GerPD [Calidifontibacillus erzurumensis]|uniref:Spore gernimation protein GerPD n=1 Tax=Calidifontibacillus erzurumensis TaxID=2741433 RepID=A0A8J8GJS2_9BACI|nr:spore gernimation protein GerPD [Calidifontibacillus erzurumensis]NSL53056.1 spore gernimation protein GerPD [Calidifontibacillus erzurumensis]